MKKIFLLFIFISGFTMAQMPNISEVWLNNSKPYTGNIIAAKKKIPLKLKINISEQNNKNDQEYFISGYTLVENNNYARFEGKLKITKYKDGKKRSTVFGEYEFVEEPKGKHSGIFTGKFIYTFQWNKKTEKIEQQYIEFIGDWKNYKGDMNYKTDLKNQ